MGSIDKFYESLITMMKNDFLAQTRNVLHSIYDGHLIYNHSNILPRYAL